jgi:Tannase-like family of unknown function (DUF6351)
MPALAAQRFEILALSNRADKVSGGDVLVQINYPPPPFPEGISRHPLWITLNGKDTTGVFRYPANSNSMIGLVGKLVVGTNTIKVQGKGWGVPDETLIVTNYPIEGPVFSGPLQEPFICQTHQFAVYAGGPFLTPAQLTDPCMTATRIDYVYRTTAGAFVALDMTKPLPGNLATTTTNQGHTVPYIVRLETGTINRSIYQIAILDDPSIPGPDLENHDDPGWNGRLAYTFGGGCSAGQFIQGSTTGGVLNDMMLSRGFAVASASLNVNGNNCNHILGAETLMMVKEHFIETFGVPRYTMGWGCSGGAVQQQTIANGYPGLLDGIVPQCSFPDNYGANTIDARLFLDYFLNKTTVPWTQEEIRLASGFGTYGQITTQGLSWAARMDPLPSRPGYPAAQFNAVVPVALRYDPSTNPTGARATTYDANVNQLGEDAHGFARRPLDNVGIQYGLATMNAGQITKAQFLDLNDRIGGLDIDANFTTQRISTDLVATKKVYETGVVNEGEHMASVPILDFDNIYSDLNVNGDVHMKFHHFSMRERLRNVQGNIGNHVMWNGVFGTRATIGAAAAFDQMDAWLTNITGDKTNDPLAAKVVRNRPPGLTDGCWIGDTTPTFVAETQFFGGTGTSICNTQYPAYGFPRYVAGEPLVNDLIKCQLKPIDLRDYQVTFTTQELAKLQAIFPTGVCDWSKPGVEQAGILSTWITYTGVGVYQPDSAP